MTKSITKYLVAAGACFSLLASSNAATIFFDNFDGLAADPLNGTTPDTTTGGATWVTGDAFFANGRAGDAVDEFGGGSNGQSATLAFTPSSGNIYNLDTRLDFDDGIADWVGFGFADGVSTGQSANNRFVTNSTPLGRAWLLIDSTGVDGGMFQDGTSVSYDGTRDGALASTGLMDVRLVLDTTAATWTVTYLAKNAGDSSYTLLKSAENVVTSGGFTSVGFAGNGDALATIDSFSLSIVPEPSSILLGSLGLLLLLRRRRNE